MNPPVRGSVDTIRFAIISIVWSNCSTFMEKGEEKVVLNCSEREKEIIYCKKHFQRFSLKDYIEERVLQISEYIIENNATVRQAAKHFGISKSTAHKDATERLEQINPVLAAKTRMVLNVNKSERHIRGGLATKEKYRQKPVF